MSRGLEELPKKRRPRPSGRERPGPSAAAVAEQLAHWDLLDDIAAVLPTRRGRRGAPVKTPPQLRLLLGILEWADGGNERACERVFTHDLGWEPVRATLQKRYGSSWSRLDRTAIAPYRSNQWQYVKTHLHDDHLWADLLAAFEEVTMHLAKQMGMFDPAKRSLTTPTLSNLITGDGVWIRPLWDAVPGEVQVNTLTGEIELKPAEWDGTVRTVPGPEGIERDEVLGTFWVLFESWLPHPGERLILSLEARQEGDDSEAKLAVQKIKHLAQMYGTVDGAVWDMALKQTHIDELYKAGLLPIVKTEKDKGDKIRIRNLGPEPLVHPGDGTSIVQDIWAVGGHAAIEVVARSETHHPLLERLETAPLRDDATGKYHWTNRYRVPDTPLVDRVLRGRTLDLRLDNTPGDLKRNKPRTSSLRAISQSDPDWDRVHGPRNAGESVNSWVKERMRWERARSAGIPKQRWQVLCAFLFSNFTAHLMHLERTNQPWPDGLPPGKARRSTPRRVPVRLSSEGLTAYDSLAERGINPDELIERLLREHEAGQS